MSETRTLETIERLRQRIHGLVNHGAEICEAFQNDLDMPRHCKRCGYQAEIHDLRDANRLIAERSEPAAASVPLSATTLLTVQSHEPHSAGATELIARVVEDELNGLGLGDFTVTLAAPAASREASVPQGGERAKRCEPVHGSCYLAAGHEGVHHGYPLTAADFAVNDLCSLSSAPGEREVR